MHRIWIMPGFLVVALIGYGRPVDAQKTAASAEVAAQYHLSVSVDEVSVSFHAADADGRSIDDLRLNELELLDNGKPPLKILAFQPLSDIPLRVGILIDMSESMDQARSKDRAAAIQYVQQLFRQRTDQAFVLNFDSRPVVAQAWTNDTSALIDGIRNRRIGADGARRVDGTAIFDAVHRACLDLFGQVDYASSVNFLLLFSDGEDNASHFSLQEAVDTCRRSDTAVFAFRTEPEPGSSSAGPKLLADLATQTGGRVFRDEDSEAEDFNDLQTIRGDLQSRYRIIYRPSDLKHDGSFHRITLVGPQRVERINVRSGYYAPTK